MAYSGHAALFSCCQKSGPCISAVIAIADAGAFAQLFKDFHHLAGLCPQSFVFRNVIFLDDADKITHFFIQGRLMHRQGEVLAGLVETVVIGKLRTVAWLRMDADGAFGPLDLGDALAGAVFCAGEGSDEIRIFQDAAAAGIDAVWTEVGLVAPLQWKTEERNDEMQAVDADVRDRTAGERRIEDVGFFAVDIGVITAGIL